MSWDISAIPTNRLPHINRIKKGDLVFFIYHKVAYCLLYFARVHVWYPPSNPNEYQQRGKNNIQKVKLSIKCYDMMRKVTNSTFCKLFRVITKINFGRGHRCSRLMILRPRFFVWTICAGQYLASQSNVQLMSLQKRKKKEWSAFTVGFKNAGEIQPDTKGQERKDVLCSYKSFWLSHFCSQRSNPLVI